MRRILFVVYLILFLLATSPALAWEFTLSGEYNWRWNYLSNIGPGDLYGNRETAQKLPGSVTSIGLSGPVNNQVVPEALTSKGSDGMWLEESLVFRPRFRVNPAVRLDTIIAFQANLNGPYVGGPGNWAAVPHRAGWYMSASRSEAILDGVTAPILRAAWLTAELPWGRFEIGRRPWSFGLGWAGFHPEDYANNSLALTVPWGPFRFLSGILFDSGEFTDAYDTRNANGTPFTIAAGTDRDKLRSWDFFLGFTYGTGPLELGYLNRSIFYNRLHALASVGGTLRDSQTASFARPFLLSTRLGGIEPVYGDTLLSNNVFYVKYFQGRFFFNLEVAPQVFRVNRDGARLISGNPLSWMVETGTVFGPGKISLAYFYRSGRSLQAGIQDVANTTGILGSDKWDAYIGGVGSAAAPYNWLIGYYGAGNDSYDPVGNPIYTDTQMLAARVDYAIASNLNFWGRWMFARRAAGSTVQGQYTGGAAPAVPTNVPTPTVADNNLGQEFGLGIDWKLLENVVFMPEVAYWKPGEWFHQARPDLSLPAGAAGQINQMNTDRVIDPILGVRIGIRLNF